VSVTDTKGRITYCNAAFVSVSGFTREELLGQPHNIVRHPDMPGEAFRDLWDTVMHGLPWTALVKNRRKNGDHYWVRANVTPMVDGEHIVGYMSVRSEAPRAEIEAADELYTQMQSAQEGVRPAIALRQGQVVRGHLIGRLRHQVGRRLAGLGGINFLVLLASFALTGAIAANAPLAASVPGIMGLGLLTGWQLRRKNTQIVARVTQDALRLAACDLSHVPAQGADGILGLLQLALAQLAVNLRTVVQDSRTDIEQVRSTVHEILAGNTDLSSRTESQASSLEQTAAAMEQITGTVKQSAASAEQGAQLAAETAAVSQRSFDAVAHVVRAMDSIKESSRRMGEITHVIEGVAFQTNILALNAAVEAARAGDSGRGFAVVAAEVRTLAQRTADAAKQIHELIAESAQRVDAGGVQATEASARMSEALSAAHKVREVLVEISSSAQEQRTGISQVNEALAHMDAVTQQNAAMVEQLAAAASSVRGQVESVGNTMRLFRLREGEQCMAEVDAIELRSEGKAGDDGRAARG
jgi:aerotaxis receptor